MRKMTCSVRLTPGFGNVQAGIIKYPRGKPTTVIQFGRIVHVQDICAVNLAGVENPEDTLGRNVVMQ